MRCDVVGALGRTAGIFVEIRIVLPLEQSLGVGTEGLLQRDDVASRGIRPPFDRDECRVLVKLDLSVLQRPDQAMQRLRVRLCLRDHERRGPGIHSPRRQCPERTLAHRRVGVEPGLPILCCLNEERPARRYLIAHDVTVRPPAAGPRRWEVPRRGLGAVSVRASRQRVEWNVDRRRDPRACCFGENARAAVIE